MEGDHFEIYYINHIASEDTKQDLFSVFAIVESNFPISKNDNGDRVIEGNDSIRQSCLLQEMGAHSRILIRWQSSGALFVHVNPYRNSRREDKHQCSCLGTSKTRSTVRQHK